MLLSLYHVKTYVCYSCNKLALGLALPKALSTRFVQLETRLGAAELAQTSLPLAHGVPALRQGPLSAALP